MARDEAGSPGPKEVTRPQAATAKRQIYLNPAIIGLLKKLPLFSVFSPEELRRILYSGQFLHLEKYEPHEIIIEEDTEGKWIYVLLQGAVKVSKKGVDICSLKGQGEVIGEIAPLKDGVRSATVVALEKTVCLAMNIAVIEHMTTEEKQQYLHKIRHFFAPMMEERMRMTQQVLRIVTEIKEKEEGIKQLQKQLQGLGALKENRNILEMLVDGGD